MEQKACAPSWLLLRIQGPCLLAPCPCLGCWRWMGCSFSLWALSPRVWSHCVRMLGCVQLSAAL